jgi:hypothetical protein
MSDGIGNKACHFAQLTGKGFARAVKAVVKSGQIDVFPAQFSER